LVRPDYHRQPILTYAEAALIAGVKAITLQTWVYTGKLSMCRRHGPYRIDALELEKYLRGPVARRK
jgi:predicted site-specific integrase-resolvase